ncbi:MAG: VWA domain-containing protein [Candidatus Helarchaeota archaeon]
MASVSDHRDYEIEDTVILIDASRSMARKDFIPQEPRINAIKPALIEWVKRKNRIDAADNYAVVRFGSEAELLVDYTNDIETVINAIQNLRIGGQTNLGEGFATALQVIIKKMQKAGDTQSGGNVNRLLIVSDGKPKLDIRDPIELAKAAAELGIIIDAIEISSFVQKSSFAGVLESMTVLGEYYHVTTTKMLDLAIRSLLHKKDVFELKKTIPRLSLIAADTLDLTILSEEMKRKVEELKGVKLDRCAICRSDHVKEYGPETIRLCFYCKTPVHAYCADQWAKESKMKEAGVFRCPHCLFLLKIPIIDERAKQDEMTEDSSVQAPDISSPSKPQRSESSSDDAAQQEKTVSQAKTAKVGDFIIDGDKLKLKTAIRGEEKLIFLNWERFGDDSCRCYLMADGEEQPLCKEFKPIINWSGLTCTGFLIKDPVGWFTRKADPNYGLFILDLNGLEEWCESVLADITSIRRIIKEHPEISFGSDRLTDFQFEANVSFAEPVDASDRNTLDGNLLMGAKTYINLFDETIKASMSADMPKRHAGPQAVQPSAVNRAGAPTSSVASGSSMASSFAKQLQNVKQVPLDRLASQLGINERDLAKQLMLLIKKGELPGFFLRDGKLMKK